MRKLLLTLMLLSAALLLPPSSRAQFIVVGQGCGASGLSAIANDGTPVVCKGSPLVWTAVGGGGGGIGSLGAAINVKTQGAVGNGKFFTDGVSNGSNNQLTSATATFSATDAGQNVVCVSLPNSVSAAVRINTTIASFVNASTLTYSGGNAGAFSGMWCSMTNPADPAAILAAFNSCKSTFNPIPTGNSATGQNPSCNVYLPSGTYGIGQTLNNLISTGNENCVGIIGDGQFKSVLIPTGNFVSANLANGGWLLNARCAGGFFKDWSVELASIPYNYTAGSAGGILNFTGSNNFIENVGVVDSCSTGAGTAYGMFALGGTNHEWHHPFVVNGSCAGTSGGLLWNGVSQGVIYSPFLSNTSQNLQIQNATSGANGSGVVIVGGVIDEGSITQVVNSVDVWFNGVTLTGGANCISVDATSFVWLTGGYCGTFGAGTGGGPTVASGGVLNMTQVHVNAINSPSACYTSAAYGGIVDDGTNRCTTSGGGVVYTSGGIINKTSLSHAQANAFQTGTLAATTNLMSFAVDQPIAVQTLSWTPNNAFACTAGAFPTFSVSDGTVTATTSVNDTSASGTVTHTFPNTTASILNPAGTVGTVITIKVVTTGTCGTAPTNTQVNVWWQATAPGA